MKIIRALWGSSEYVENEVPEKPLFENEIVFVWGSEKVEMLKDKGYEVVLLCDTITDPDYSTHLTHFAHKLLALKAAEERYDEYLFLDWDITLNKPIDDNFWDRVRMGGSLQMPLYAYHRGYREDLVKWFKGNDPDRFDKNLDEFIYYHIESLYKYHWPLDDALVLPCACFIYSNGIKIGTHLLEVMHKHDIKACIEEFCMYIWADCTLEEYVEFHEPYVLRGKEKDHNLEGMTKAIKHLNKWMETKIPKDIYLFHDL